MSEDAEKKCLKCGDPDHYFEPTGWVTILDPRQDKPEKKRCPNGCKVRP